MVRVLFVCLGNICRSPMAEFIFKDMIKKEGLENQFFIDSAATSDYNEKNKNSIYSKQMKKDDYYKFDYILTMEEENIKNILKIIGDDSEKKVFKLLDFTQQPRDIIDPWYYGDFNATYEDIKYGCEKFLEYLLKKNIIRR